MSEADMALRSDSDRMKSQGISKVSPPFYEPPQRKTSAEIINEARLAIRDSQVADNTFASPSIKPLQTQRPYTPRDKERLLFGNKAKSNRPPSSFSLRYLQNETEIPTHSQDNILLPPNMVTSKTLISPPKSSKIPNKPHHQRSNSLSEINDTIFNISIKDPLHKVKLPSLDASRPLQKRKIFKNTTSLDNLPEESEYTEPQRVESRNAFSSPQERTDFNNDSLFGRPSAKQKNLSQCLLLGPQNLEKIFDNKQIVEHSQTLFLNTGYFNSNLHNKRNTQKLQDYILVDEKRDRTFEDVLTELNCENDKNHDEDRLITLLNELYDCMEKENLNNQKVSSKLKIRILRCLYKFVESQNELILISIAIIILSLKVTGNNLSGVCKLIFKVAKNDKNDNLFFQRNLLELFLDALGRSSPLDDAEACVYGYGAVKFLTMNQKLLQKILDLGILQLMVLHIKLINTAMTELTVETLAFLLLNVGKSPSNCLVDSQNSKSGVLRVDCHQIPFGFVDYFTRGDPNRKDIILSQMLEKTSMPEQTNHVLFQLTGALRNLVSEENIYKTFISCGAIPQLCQALEIFAFDSDVIANISRTLSIISTNECCCDTLVEYKNIYGVLISLFDKFAGNEEIIVRLAYTLGNIVAKIDNTRVKFYYEEGSIDSLLKLWKIYLDRTLQNCSLKVEAKEESNSNSEDVMIKIIRVIANMVINPEVGKALNEKYGAKLIGEIIKVLISNPFKKNEELVLSILSTLNNLSYYYTSEIEIDIFHIKQVDIVEAITEFSKSKNKECVIETMRILGNLSRSKITRNYIAESEVFEILMDILGKADPTLLKTTVGVFVNLMSDNRSRILFKTSGGVEKLIKTLTHSCDNDWMLGNLVCQVLWNYCIDSVDLHDLFSEKEIHKLLILLADLLDEEKLFGIEEHVEDMDVYVSQEYLIWEEFANVATNLLEKIEFFLDTFDQINIDNEKTDIHKNTKDSSTNLSFSSW